MLTTTFTFVLTFVAVDVFVVNEPVVARFTACIVVTFGVVFDDVSELHPAPIRSRIQTEKNGDEFFIL